MVGLGETPEEVEELMDDLRRAGCQILTIGQYLQPSHKHYPVAEYVTPTQFVSYKEQGLAKGFDRWRVHRWCVLLIMPRNKFGSIKKEQNKNQLLYLFVMYEVTAK